MNGKDMDIEQELPTIEQGLKISLRVEVNEEGQLGIQCNYNQASTVLLLQTIAYMLDTAYEGKEELMATVAEQIPGIIKEYCRLKEMNTKIENITKDIDELISSSSDEVLKSMTKDELSKDNPDMDMVMKMSSELLKRGLKDDRERNKTKSTDSI